VRVFKFPIEHNGTTELKLPYGSHCVRVAWQGGPGEGRGDLYTWWNGAFDVPESHYGITTVVAVFTGEEVPKNTYHLGSLEHNGIVIHVFEQL
jgi:hypothetical protein